MNLLAIATTLLKTTVYSFLGLLGFLILLIAVKEVISYLKLKKYKMQHPKVKTVYYPLKGLSKYLLRACLDAQTRQNCDEIVKNAELVAGNSFFTTEPQLYITGTKFLKEFLLVENELFKRANFDGKPHPSKSFFFENGEVGLAYRSIFTEFFRADNVRKIIPGIEAVFQEKFSDLGVELFGEKVELKNGRFVLREGCRAEEIEWRAVDLKPYLVQPFDEIINVIFFGSKSKQECPVFDDGKVFSQAVRDYIMLKIKAKSNIPDLLTGGLAGKLRLTKISREWTEYRDKFFRIINDFYDQRKASGSYQGVNLVDLMIRHNEKVQK